jgi:hypothetical protein
MTVIDAAAIIRHNRPMNLIERLRDWLIISLLLMLADFRYSSESKVSKSIEDAMRILQISDHSFYFAKAHETCPP